MSIDTFTVDAVSRTDEGKGASRRLRRAGKFPAVIYGGDKAPQSITLEHNYMLRHVEHEAFFSHILDINVDGKTEKAILKDIQWHNYKPAIVHMDFLRVDASSVIKVQVPVHVLGEDVCPGAKAGGVVSHQMNSVEVTCPASKLPEFIEADVSALNVGESLHLSDLKLPEGVSLVELSHGAEHDLPVVTVVVTRGAAAESTTEEDGEGEETSE